MSGLGSGPMAPEVKAYGREADAVGALMETFEAFREANDQRLGELEAKLSADVVTDEKVTRINAALTEQKAALDRLAVEMRRPHGGGAVRSRGEDEGRAALAAYVRKGDAGAISRLELKEDKLSRGTDSEGGYLVPEETERRIDSLLAQVSPIRAIATVRQIAGQSFRLPVSRNGFASGWAAETGARAQTDAADLSLVEFPAMELYAMPAASNRCSTMRWWMSRAGWPRRCSTPSPPRRARPSSTATAPISRAGS